MKTLLYMITLSELGGAQSHLLQLITSFHNHYNVHLVTSADGPLTLSVRKLGVTVHLLPSLGRAINFSKDFHTVRECINLLRLVKPDLVHVHSSKAGLVGRLAASYLNIPCVFTAHGWGFKPGVPLKRRLVVWASEFLAAPLCHTIICVSRYDRELAVKYGVGNKEKLVVIHNGLDDCEYLAKPACEPVKIIMAARFQEPKDQQTLLYALAELHDEKVELILVGGGPKLASSQNLASTLGISDRVKFLGDRTDVPELLARSQIFVLLSYYEGLPISILEAMRAGLPVVASNVGGVPEELEDDVTGILVKTNDINSTKRALHRLITNPCLRVQMGAVSRQRFLEKFLAEHMISKTDKIYCSILYG
jgi:glycosyltransferase involved in cell wall biosynthesis